MRGRGARRNRTSGGTRGAAGRAGARGLAAVLLALAPAACGVPIESGAAFAGGVQPPRALTFAWDQERDLVMGDPRLENNPFFEERLHEAVEWELSMRGIRLADSGPDLVAHHHLALRDHEMVEERVDGVGDTVTDSYRFEEGTVVVHLTNARTGQSVWVGWARASVEPALGGPEAMRTWVYDLTREMFKEWPTLVR